MSDRWSEADLIDLENRIAGVILGALGFVRLSKRHAAARAAIAELTISDEVQAGVTCQTCHGRGVM